MSRTRWARVERSNLVAAARVAGPDAPTLCGQWTVRELLAHLVLREARPDAAAGIIVPAFAGRTAKVQAKIAAQPFDDLLTAVESGPPMYSPFRAIDAFANLSEMFVHHEDIRRGAGPAPERPLDIELERKLLTLSARLAKASMRSVKVAVELVPVFSAGSGAGEEVGRDGTGARGVVVGRRGAAAPGGIGSVRVTGSPGELLLWVTGRDPHVQIEGDDVSLALLATTRRNL